MAVFKNPSKKCKHPTCSDFCRREKKPRKIYVLKRTPIKKTRKRINRVSQKRKAENEIYHPEREEFLKQGRGMCELKTPVCTRQATCIHHTEGRVGDDFLDKSKWKRSCHPCNNWVEANSAKAKELGLKKPNYKSKLTGVKKL